LNSIVSAGIAGSLRFGVVGVRRYYQRASSGGGIRVCHDGKPLSLL